METFGNILGVTLSSRCEGKISERESQRGHRTHTSPDLYSTHTVMISLIYCISISLSLFTSLIIKAERMLSVVGGVKRWTPEEIVKVAVYHNMVAVEDAVLERLLSEEQPTHSHNVEFLADPGSSYLPKILCRSGIMCRLISLSQAKTAVRKSFVKLLVDLLNNNITPCLYSNLSAGNDLLSVLTGKGFCELADGSVVASSVALAGSGSNILTKLTSEEINALRNYPFISIGTGCVISAGASNLIKVVDVIGALGCELRCVNVEPFESMQFEGNRAHRGQMVSASNIRILLEGSKRVNSLKTFSVDAPTDFHNIPQIHGPCQEVIVASSKSVTRFARN
jgi:hypothetical protein